MKRGAICVTLSLLMVISLVLASCGTKTTTTSTTTSTTAAVTTTTTTTSVVNTATTTGATSTTTTTATGHWWDYQGQPQYGGTILVGATNMGDMPNWDPYYNNAATIGPYLEQLWTDDWTLDPSVFAFRWTFRPPDNEKGGLAVSWEMPDSHTFIAHLRQNVYWQNISPANGRQFTANDVVWNMDRYYGLGAGFTTPSPYVPSDVSARVDLKTVVATDKFTVTYGWASNNPEYILETQMDQGTATQDVLCPEAVQAVGNVSDWHRALGTGPFILKDVVPASSVTFVKNPSYWGYDDRHPENKLPYVDGVKVLNLPNRDTALAALRTGKIESVEGNSIQQSIAMKKTNPEIVQVPVAQAAECLYGRNDKGIFADINVRKAFQMAMNIPLIASTFYSGDVKPIPEILTASIMTGWGNPYPNWPQSLKDEYAFNQAGAKQLLAQAGYPNGMHTDVVANASSNMDLLQIIVSQLSDIGVTVDIRQMDSASWGTYCMTNHSYDALTFADGRPYGNAYSPIRQLKLFMTGFGGNYGLVSDPVFDTYYPAAMAATDLTTIKKILSDANLHVAQQHYAVSLVLQNNYNFVQPWLVGYNAQSGWVGGFYLARFWVNQTLKASMGH